jgi:hypothetical protein
MKLLGEKASGPIINTLDIDFAYFAAALSAGLELGQIDSGSCSENGSCAEEINAFAKLDELEDIAACAASEALESLPLG